MASRFYLHNATAAAITPGIAAWTDSTAYDRKQMSPTKDVSAMATKHCGPISGNVAANGTMLARQFISDPLASGIAFVTSDTFTCVIRAAESGANDNINRQAICVKVYSEDGTTLRATLFALGNVAPNTTEWATSLQSEIWSAVAGTALTANYTTVARDRLVVEVGGMCSSAGGTGVDGSLSFGSNSGTDLSTTEHVTTANNPWFEISRTVTFTTNHVLAGAVTAAATVAGTISLAPATRALTGAVSAVATGAGKLNSTFTLVGAARGAATLGTPTLKLTKLLVGAADGHATVAGAVSLARGLLGTGVGTSTVAADLSVELGGTDQLLTGVAVCLATVSGKLNATLKLVGAVNGVATVTGRLGVLRPLIGSASATATVSGRLNATLKFAGTASGAATVAGKLNSTFTLVGAARGAATLGTPALTLTKRLVGAVDAHATASGSLSTSAVRLFAGGLGAVGTLGAPAIKLTRLLVGSAAAAATVQGSVDLAGAAALDGRISGSASLAGQLRIVTILAGAATGAGTAQGVLGVVRPLEGSQQGSVFVRGTISRNVGLSGALAGEATIQGTPYGVVLPRLIEGTVGAGAFVRGRIWIYRAIDYLDVDVSSCRLGSPSLTEGTLSAVGATTRVTLIGT